MNNRCRMCSAAISQFAAKFEEGEKLIKKKSWCKSCVDKYKDELILIAQAHRKENKEYGLKYL